MNTLFRSNEIELPQRISKPNSLKLKTSAEKKKMLLGKRYDKCKEVIGVFKKKSITHYVSMGEWSMHDLLRHLLTQTGPAKVIIATWSISSEGAKTLIKLADTGHITNLNAIFDWRIKIRCPEALQLARLNFTNIRLTSCHAKVTLIRNQEYNICICSSANYTNNPRIEAGVIHDDFDTAEYYENWISSVLENSDPFETKK